MAETEYCPAFVVQTQLLDVRPGGKYTLFAYRLQAASARAVSGAVAVKTSTGWFTLPFSDVKLTERDEQWQSPTTVFKRRAFVSAPLYARMPEDVSVVGQFVEEAEASGDSVFGWDAKGRVQCAVPTGFITHKSFPKDGLSQQNPIDEPGPPVAGTAIATASITTAPGDESCPIPFADATVTMPMQPQYPRDLQVDGVTGTTYAAVAINADGKPDDVWVWGTSAYGPIDRETLRAARLSRYRSETSFCAPAPGIYLFRADYRPGY